MKGKLTEFPNQKTALFAQLDEAYELAKDLVTEILPANTAVEAQDIYFRILKSLQQLRDIAIQFNSQKPEDVRYFAKITGEYIRNNNLQKEISAIATARDARILQGRELDEYLKDFEHQVNKACLKHPRCKPTKLRVNRDGQAFKEMIVSVDGVFHMAIWEESQNPQSAIPNPSIPNPQP